MTAPRTVYVPLRVRDTEDALRIADAINAALNALWEVYGEEMGERMLDRHCADGEDAPPLPNSMELPF